MSAVLIWTIAAGTIAGILFRPRHWPEAIWACLGAALLVLFRLLPPSSAWSAIGKGTDVYLFLTGMMLLAELARREGVFDWLAGHAVQSAGGSRTKLFALVYGVGILVTVFLSNDATAVVLTPAVYAAVKKARVDALPYLLACAFIANAASFVLPISNPANLVVYGKLIPPLLPWLKMFFLPSIISILVTFLALRLISDKALQGKTEDALAGPQLSPEGRHAAWGIAIAGAVLISASALGWDLGLPTAWRRSRRCWSRRASVGPKFSESAGLFPGASCRWSRVSLSLSKRSIARALATQSSRRFNIAGRFRRSPDLLSHRPAWRCFRIS